jgi:uncharacterized membrane protein YciS (DUF1049 family)
MSRPSCGWSSSDSSHYSYIRTGIFFIVQQQSLSLDLHFKQYKTPDLSIGIFFIACFLAGLITAYLFTLAERLRNRKEMKKLKLTIQTQKTTIEDLNKKISDSTRLKHSIPPPPLPARKEDSPGDTGSATENKKKEALSIKNNGSEDKEKVT